MRRLDKSLPVESPQSCYPASFSQIPTQQQETNYSQLPQPSTFTPIHPTDQQFPESPTTYPRWPIMPTFSQSMKTVHPFPYIQQKQTPDPDSSTGYLQMPQPPTDYHEQSHLAVTANLCNMPIPIFAGSNSDDCNVDKQNCSYHQENLLFRSNLSESPRFPSNHENQNLHTAHLQEDYAGQYNQPFEESRFSWSEKMPSPWVGSFEQLGNPKFPDIKAACFNQNPKMPQPENTNHGYPPFLQGLNHFDNEQREKSEITSPSDPSLPTPLSANIHFPACFPQVSIGYESMGVEPENVSSALNPIQRNEAQSKIVSISPEATCSGQISPSNRVNSNVSLQPNEKSDFKDSLSIPPIESEANDITSALEQLKFEIPLSLHPQINAAQSIKEDPHDKINDASPEPESVLGGSSYNEELSKNISSFEKNIGDVQCLGQDNNQDVEEEVHLFTDSDSDDEPEGSALPLLFEASEHLLTSEYIVANELYTLYPPKFTNKNKLALFNQFSSKMHQPGDWIVQVSRWKTPETHPNCTYYQEDGYSLKIRLEEEYSTYPTDSKGCTWYVHFCGGELFSNYGGAELSTGELHVLEHPLLGSVKELLVHLSKTYPALTPKTLMASSTSETTTYKSTPILIQEISQMCTFSMLDGTESQNQSLYQKHFGSSNQSKLLKEFHLCPSTNRNNFICIASPPEGHQAYDFQTIHATLMTAYSSFAAARFQSYQKCGYIPAHGDLCTEENADTPERPLVVIHSGAWGAGKRGGNRVLMHLVQMLAARLAGVDRIVFHSCRAENTKAFLEAERLYDTVWNRFINTPEKEQKMENPESSSIVKIIMSLKEFLWQNSDPNEKKGSSKWFFSTWS